MMTATPSTLGNRVVTWEFLTRGEGNWRVTAGVRMDGTPVYSTNTFVWSVDDDVLELTFAAANPRPRYYYVEFLSEDVFQKTSIGGLTPGNQHRLARYGTNLHREDGWWPGVV